MNSDYNLSTCTICLLQVFTWCLTNSLPPSSPQPWHFLLLLSCQSSSLPVSVFEVHTRTWCSCQMDFWVFPPNTLWYFKKSQSNQVLKKSRVLKFMLQPTTQSIKDLLFNETTCWQNSVKRTISLSCSLLVDFEIWKVNTKGHHIQKYNICCFSAGHMMISSSNRIH